MKQYYLHIFFLLLTVQLSIAQQFPVQVIPQTIPPRPVLLSDYANPAATNDRVRVQLILNDLTELNREVRLKVFITGQGINAQSNDLVIGANPIFLEGGVPSILGAAELAPYFDFQNLQGISPGAYGTALPEGPYSICFEVFDQFTGNQIAARTCTNFILFSNDPPLLNLPLNASGIQEMLPMNLVFQWTPRHINVSNVQYELTIAELWDLNIDPQAAFLSSPAIFQTTTTQTTFIYDGLQPSLVAGRRYGWRVRAFATEGAEEIGLFNNNGFSEIFYFDYQTQCDPPLFPSVDELSNRSAKIVWQGNFDHLDYTFKYREKNAGSEWYDITTPREYITVDNLNAETTYEYKVLGNCSFGSFGETLIYEFTTLDDASSAYQGCAIEPDPIHIENQELLPQLFINDVFTAGDFPITVQQVTNDTAPFSGGGYVIVPWLGDTKIAVAFEGIQINTEMQLISGQVETTYDADWGNVEFIDDLVEIFEGDNDLDNIQVDFDIPTPPEGNYEDYIEVNEDGSITITDPDTNVEITYPAGDDVQIIDNNPDGPNDIFVVDEDGNVTYGGTESEDGPVDTQNTPGFDINGNITQLSAPGIKVTFEEDNDYVYGYDKVPTNQYDKLSSVYDRIEDASGNDYDIIHKAIKREVPEIIKATVTTEIDSLYNRLEFKTESGRVIEHTRVGQSNIVELPTSGLFSFENELVYAVLKADTTQTNSQETIAGTFRLWHLSEREADITIVRVNNATLPSDYEQQLSTIYGKAAVNLTYSSVIDYAPDPSLYGGDTIEVGESGVLSNYTLEERAIINDFKNSIDYNVNTYYLFVFGNDVQPSRAIAGFMPLKHQYGFIFDPSTTPEENTNNRVKIMAHELGHGIFGLEHPFTQFDTDEGATDWTMDYGDGTRLVHTDWAQIHNPDFQLYLFQDDEDGEFTYLHLTPNWIPFEFKDSNSYVAASTITSPNGAVYGIKYEGKQYLWNSSSNSNGGEYRSSEDSTPLPIIQKPNIGVNTVIEIYWNRGQCGFNETYKSSWGYLKDKESTLNVDTVTDGSVYDMQRIPCTSSDGVNIGSFRNEALCEQYDVSELNSQRIALENIVLESANFETLISQVNSISICATRRLSYEKVEEILLFIINNAGYNNDSEKALVKLINSISEDKLIDFYTNVLKPNSASNLKSLLNNLTNTFFYFFGDDNYNHFLETLTYIINHLSNESDKIFVFNTIIREKYSDLGQVEQIAFGNILSELEVYVNVKSKVHSATPIFLEMLIEDLSSLNDYLPVFNLALERLDKRALLANFTQWDKVKIYTGDNALGIPQYIIQTNDDLNWIKPSAVDLVDQATNQVVTVPVNDLHNYYWWANYILNNPSSDNIIESNEVEFFNIFNNEINSFVESKQNESNEFWNNLNIVDCNDAWSALIQIAAYENTNSLKIVDKSKRLLLFEKIFDCEFDDELPTIIDNVDDGLMKLVTSFEPNDVSILNKIEEVGLDKIYDVLSGSRLSKMFVWMGAQILSTAHYNPIDYNQIFKPDGTLKNKDNLLKLEANIFEFDNFSSTIQNKIEIIGDEEVYNYNQLVVVYVEDDFTFIEHQFKRGDVLMVPMVHAFAMSNSNRNIVATNSAWLAVDVLSFAIGIGEVKVLFTAGNVLRKVIVASDLVGTSAGILSAALNQSVISPDLRFKIEMLSIVASVPQLATSIKSIDNLITSTDNSINALTGINSLQKSEIQKYFTKIKEKIPLSSAIDDFISGLGVNYPELFSKYNNLNSDLKDLFRQDFLTADTSILNQLNKTGDESILFETWLNFRNKYPNRIFSCN